MVSASLLLFGQALWFDFVPYDDPAYVTENGLVSKGITLDGIKWAFFYGGDAAQLSHAGVENLWHPLTWMSHMLDVELFGTKDASGHHAVNILLHTLSGILVMWVASILLKSPWTSFFIALLWLVHPLKVESVAWVSERKDVLSGVFFWLALGLALKEGKRWHQSVGFLAFLLALLCKPSVVILPLLLILCEGYLSEEKSWNLRFWFNGIRKRTLWLVASAVVSLVTIFMQSGGSHQSSLQNSTFSERLLELAASFWFLFARIFWPLNLSYEYEPPSVGTWVFYLAWAGLAGCGFLLWRFRKEWPSGLFGGLWFLICWLPSSGLVYVGTSFTADRYAYLALLGPLFAIASIPLESKWQRVAIALTLPFWSLTTWNQLPTWRNGWALFGHATEARPSLSSGWLNLGGMHQDHEEWHQARQCYLRALTLEKDDYLTWYNLGNTEKALNLADRGESSYRRALELKHDYAPALLNLGLLLRESGALPEARDLFRSGGSPSNPLLMLLWSESELLLGNGETSWQILKNLQESDPKNQQVLNGMNQLLDHLDKKEVR